MKLVSPGKCKVIYHEFEVVEPAKIRDRFLKKGYETGVNDADLVLIPERNRLEFFLSNTKTRNRGKVRIFANSCPTVVAKKNDPSILPTLSNDDFVIGHIGNAGAEHHLRELLDVFSEISAPNVKLLFVGQQSPETEKIFTQYKLKSCFTMGQVKHEHLPAIYERLDLGLILYRDVDINFRFCAPNKLYEYWANNVPVLANRLPGLVPVFSRPFLGALVDFDDKEKLLATLNRYISLGRTSHSLIKDYFDDHLVIHRNLSQLDTILN